MTGLWRVRGDVLVGYVDECAVRDVALMRFAWRSGALGVLVPRLAGGLVTMAALRAEFRALLEACRG
jgi:hypothetical protein